MDYTIEEVYQLVGKEDKVATLEFKEESEAYETYGDSITVEFVFTQKEREWLDNLIQSKPFKNHRYLKAKYLGFDLEEDKVNLLLTKGVHTVDIENIIYSIAPPKNTFHSIAKREMNKINLPLKPQPKGRDLDWMYGFTKKQMIEGIGLSPKEKAFYYGGKLFYESDKLSEIDKSVIYKENGELIEDIEWELLKIKYEREEIQDKELERFAELYGIKVKDSTYLLDNYLNQAGSSLKNLNKENPKQAEKLMLSVLFYNERRLTVLSKHPIYIDLDGYLHIYMRHVEEYQVSKHFENKDNFQWDEEDVFSVMGKVIHEIEKEYEEFRKNNPTKRYSRYGEQSVYFQGDYYTVHIEPNGRISTFHKNKKKLNEESKDRK